MSRSALFVIDIQGELAVDPKTRIPHVECIKPTAGDKILAAARAIIDSFRHKGAQSPSIIVFVYHEDETMMEGSDPWRLIFDPRDGVEEEILVAKSTSEHIGSTYAMLNFIASLGVIDVQCIVSRLSPVLMHERVGNTFETNPGLADWPKSEGIAELVTFGIQSEYCVLETSKGALDLGFSVMILQGAHSTYDQDRPPPGKAAAAIERDVEQELKHKGAQVLRWEDTIATWEQWRMIFELPHLLGTAVRGSTRASWSIPPFGGDLGRGGNGEGRDSETACPRERERRRKERCISKEGSRPTQPECLPRLIKM